MLREDPDRVRASQRARGEDEGAVDVLIGADERRRKAVAAADSLRAELRDDELYLVGTSEVPPVLRRRLLPRRPRGLPASRRHLPRATGILMRRPIVLAVLLSAILGAGMIWGSALSRADSAPGPT